MALLRILKHFQNYFEMVIFTYLPRRFVDLILKEVPGMSNYFNFILTSEEASWRDDYLIKDCSLLLGNRELLELYVIDSTPDEVDTDSVSSLNPPVYEGIERYQHLEALLETLKASIRQ